MGRRVTPRNAPFLYHATRNMVAELRLCLALYFSIFALLECFAPEKAPSLLAWGWMLSVFPLIPYLIRLARIRRL